MGYSTRLLNVLYWKYAYGVLVGILVSERFICVRYSVIVVILLFCFWVKWYEKNEYIGYIGIICFYCIYSMVLYYVV